MVNFSNLVEYFDYLARNHVDIGHTDDERHYYRFELDEVFTSLGSNINFKALILEGYDFNFGDSDSDNLQKQRNGAFIIIDHEGDENNYTRINQIYDECEAIGDEIIVRIAADKRNRNIPVVRNFDIRGTQGNMVANAGEGYYGMRYTFSLHSPRTNDVDPDKWKDAGQYSPT